MYTYPLCFRDCCSSASLLISHEVHECMESSTRIVQVILSIGIFMSKLNRLVKQCPNYNGIGEDFKEVGWDFNKWKNETTIKTESI